jgi:hypothetical protein
MVEVLLVAMKEVLSKATEEGLLLAMVEGPLLPLLASRMELGMVVVVLLVAIGRLLMAQEVLVGGAGSLLRVLQASKTSLRLVVGLLVAMGQAQILMMAREVLNVSGAGGDSVRDSCRRPVAAKIRASHNDS